MADLTPDPSNGRRDLSSLANRLAQRRRLADAEIYSKRGRSRMFAIEWRPRDSASDQVAHQVRDRHEVGWAIRYGNKRGWGFTAGSGEVPPDPALSPPQSGRLLLPQTPGPEPRTETQTALASETQALRGLKSIGDALPAPVIARRLELQDGEAVSVLANNHGVSTWWPHRTGLVSLEEWLPGGAVLRLHAVDRDAVGALEIAARDWPRIVSLAVRVRWSQPRFADGLPAGSLDLDGAGDAEIDVSARESTSHGERSSVVLTAHAAAPLIGAALASWRGEARDATVASPVVRLCDAPDWQRGPMSTPVDGQGDSAVRRTVVQGGRLVAALSDPEVAVVRRGWRDLPLPGYQQAVLLPGSAGIGELIAGVSRGWWLPARVEVPVAAKGSRQTVFLGRPILDGAIDHGSEPRLLPVHTDPVEFCRSIRELADEVSFQPARTGIIGVPALRVEGVRVAGGG